MIGRVLEERKKQMKKQFILILGVFFLFAGHAVIDAKAVEALYYNHSAASIWAYDNTEIHYNYNGAEVELNGKKGLMGSSGSALAPLDELFTKTLKVDCELKLSDSSVTLREGSNAVSFIPGSKQAVVNGKKDSMSEAPLLLQDSKDELSLYVPTRFIASGLGFDYEWNKALSTVFIEKTFSIRYQSDNTEKPIAIPLYSDISVEDIRVEDLYDNHKIAVYIPGEYAEKYEDKAIVNHYSAITGIELAVNAQNETVFVFSTSKIKACKPEIKDNTLYLHFMNPRELYSKIVVIDPGHGGYDPGAIRDKVNESDLNLAIAYAYTKDLFQDSDIKVYYTRTTDKFISLNDRAAFAAQVGADFFVSVHQNTFTTDAKKGVSVYYSSDNKNTGVTGLTGRIMAGLFAERISTSLGLNHLGRLNQRLSVTTYNSVPAALIELAFMSNPDDFAKLKTPEFQKKAGKVIFETIVEIFETYPTNR